VPGLSISTWLDPIIVSAPATEELAQQDGQSPRSIEKSYDSEIGISILFKLKGLDQ
jgi:hypothetical protein